MRAVIEDLHAHADYEIAKSLNLQACGSKISRQTWAIVRKIHEADELMRSYVATRDVVVESHPEIVFAALNGWMPMQYPKRTADGIRERFSVLQPFCPDAEKTSRAFFLKNRGKVQLDDVVDALAMAVGASFAEYKTIPERPDTDDHGLPMRIAYPVVNR
jgi:predicted RNase H-like nuclease